MSTVHDILQKHFPAVQTFRDSLDPETDRGCAIAAASYVDDQLASMIKAHLIESNKLVGELFSGKGSLSTFSSRIDISYLLAACRT